VPTKKSLQEKQAEDAALLRAIIEAIATEALEQRIAEAGGSRKAENVNAPSPQDCRNDKR